MNKRQKREPRKPWRAVLYRKSDNKLEREIPLSVRPNRALRSWRRMRGLAQYAEFSIALARPEE